MKKIIIYYRIVSATTMLPLASGIEEFVKPTKAETFCKNLKKTKTQSYFSDKLEVEILTTK